MALDKKAVLEALKPVMDPELKMSIMDLGMVKEVRVENDDVYVKIALTAEGCPLVEVEEYQYYCSYKGLGQISLLHLLIQQKTF